MRITGGEWGGRRLKTPPGDGTRPTQDWVREALFSIFASIVPESKWLDLFAGSGAVGLDALSRGASSVTWVENNPQAARLIHENFLALAGEGGSVAVEPRTGAGLPHAVRRAPRHLPAFPLPERFPGAELVVASAEAWLAGPAKGRLADIAFADPPYEMARTQGFAKMLALCKDGDVIKADGFFAGEMPDDVRAAPADGWEIARDKTYGRTRLVLWRRLA